VADPIHDRDAVVEALRLVTREAEEYLGSLDDSLVPPRGQPAHDESMPDSGVGSLRALSDLIAASRDGAVQSSGPRYFHFVTGGVTPAALGADWLASTLDQMAFNWTSSPFASRLEQVATGWLRDLCGLPRDWSALITTGATMANFVGLASARRWWGQEHGVDVDNDGMAGLPAVPVFAGGYLHASCGQGAWHAWHRPPATGGADTRRRGSHRPRRSR